MNFNIFVPQIFYDIIGRFIPGFTILFFTLLLFTPPDQFSLLNNFPVLSLLLVIIISYCTGALLGGIWFKLLDIKFIKKILTDRYKVDSKTEKMSKENVQYSTSYMYDFIQYYSPQAGARLAKLRGEQHFCGVIIIGSFLLLLIIIIKTFLFFEYDYHFLKINNPQIYLFIFIPFLVLVITGAACFYTHLADRLFQLLINNWNIILDDQAKKINNANFKKNEE